jgi:hypothetical protein
MTTRRLAALLALAAALAVSSLAGPSSASAFRVGIQDDQAFVLAPPAQRTQAFNRAKAIGASYLRINLVWQSYRDDGFGPYDAAVNAARQRGMKVQLTVTGNPSYVNGGRGFIGRRPVPARYAAWIGKVARHFRGRVYAYAVWNEPNLGLFFLPQGKPGQRLYRKVYRSAYRSVKRADRRAKVLIGETAPSNKPLRFLAGVAKGGGVVADGWAHHPYQFVNVAPGRPERRYTGISNVPKMKRELRRFAAHKLLRTPSGRPLPLYFTEFGYPRQGALYGLFSEPMRADYSVRAMRIARRAGAQVMVWYQVYNPASMAKRTLWDTGLIGRDGSESLVYRRLRAARASLAR